LYLPLFTGTGLPTLVGLTGKGQMEEDPGWKQSSPDQQGTVTPSCLPYLYEPASRRWWDWPVRDRWRSTLA